MKDNTNTKTVDTGTDAATANGSAPAVEDLALITAERNAAQARVADLEKEKIGLIEERDAATSSHGKLEEDYAEVSKQRDTLSSENTKLKKRPALTAAPKPLVRRRAGPVEGIVDADKVFKALTTLDHEIVFSDGQEEILALPPVIASPEAWLRTGAGTMLRTPITICPNTKIDLAGFALFLGDTQVAWCPMAQPVAIASGQQVKLDRQIIF